MTGDGAPMAPMAPEREAHLRRMIAGLASLDEVEGAREQLAQAREITGAVYSAPQKRVDELAAREGVSAQRWWRRNGGSGK